MIASNTINTQDFEYDRIDQLLKEKFYLGSKCVSIFIPSREIRKRLKRSGYIVKSGLFSPSRTYIYINQ